MATFTIVMWIVCFVKLPMAIGSACSQNSGTVVNVCQNSTAMSSNISLDPGSTRLLEQVRCRCALTMPSKFSNMFVSANGWHNTNESYDIRETRIVAGYRDTMKIYNNEDIIYEALAKRLLCLQFSAASQDLEFTIECFALTWSTTTSTSSTTTTGVPTETAAIRVSTTPTVTGAPTETATTSDQYSDVSPTKTGSNNIFTMPYESSSRSNVSSMPAFNPSSSTSVKQSAITPATTTENSDNKLVFGMIGAFAAGAVLALMVGLLFKVRKYCKKTRSTKERQNMSDETYIYPIHSSQFNDPPHSTIANQRTDNDAYINPVHSSDNEPPRVATIEQYPGTNEYSYIYPDVGYECVGRVSDLQNERAPVHREYENNYMYLNRTDTAEYDNYSPLNV